MTPELDAFGNPVGSSATAPAPAPTAAPPPPPPSSARDAPPPAPAPPYAPPPYAAPPAYAGIAPTPSEATTALVVGLFGLWFWLLSPFAWVLGRRAVRLIDTSQGRLGGRGTANAGRILGIIGTVLLVVSIVFLIFAVLLVAGGAVHSTSSSVVITTP